MKRSLPPLSALRAFEAAARHGRMILAAEELSVTPGAVSRQVRLLEEALGVALFEGPKSKPRLTEAGRTLAPRLADAFDGIEAATRAARAVQAAVLDVSCLSTFLMRWLIPRLYRFTAQHPGIDVRLRAAEGPVNPERDRFDAVITIVPEGPLTTGEDRLFPEWLGPVGTPALSAGITRIEDLAQAPLLNTKTRPDAWGGWTRNPPQGAWYEHYYFTLEATAAGLGLCLAPWHLVAADIASGRLVAPLGFTRSGFEYRLKTRRHAAAGLEPFRAWLRAEAAAQAMPDQPCGPKPTADDGREPAYSQSSLPPT
ncbi:MAG: LysR substrate-binding domain-containing protein [Elstera sp.]